MRRFPDPGHRRPRRARALLVALVALAVAGGPAAIATPSAAHGGGPPEVQSLDGSGNNRAHPTWGMAGTEYPRDAPARYADGIGEPVAGPNARYISNRVFNDTHQSLLSEGGVSQWGFVWGQFLDHTFALRLGRRGVGDPGEPMNIPFDNTDPVEEFRNDLGAVFVDRSVATPGTGEDTIRQQTNLNSSYLDAGVVYSLSEEVLEWLRDGPVDGDMSNNQASLLLPDHYLPRRASRGDPDSAPLMVFGGREAELPGVPAVAGDPRANENPTLTATHTLFAREHNRIVSQLPHWLPEAEKFRIARRVIIAEQQYITYHEFLPALGVTLPPYRGYDPRVRTDLSNEFATVGYRAHSLIRGDFRLEVAPDRYDQETLDEIAANGVDVEVGPDQVVLTIPLGEDAFFNPDLLELVELGPMMHALGLRSQTSNDELIDNHLRSFQVAFPVEGNEQCLPDPALPPCLNFVNDLGSIDIERGRDHGIPTYNQLRQAYGLPPAASFTDITGEDTEQFPPGLGVDDPASLEFVELYDIDGEPIDLDSPRAATDAVRGVRASTLAARLKGVYGDVDDVEAFVGMVSEPHLPGAEFGELQLAIWQRQFAALRDGDRFFYGNLRELDRIRKRYGIDFRRGLADLIAGNTDIPRSALADNVFLAEDVPPASCHVDYRVRSTAGRSFLAKLTVTNTSDRPVQGWELAWRFASGQRASHAWHGRVEQHGPDVTVTDRFWNRRIRPGDSERLWLFGRWDRATNPDVTHFALNGQRCTTS